MGLETGSTISSFITSNPTSSDPVNQGDDHLRLIKSVLQAQFPGAAGNGFATAITATEAEINALHGLTNFYFPSGTRIPFAQAAAPTGWTQDVTDKANNRMLRVVSSAGNGVGGSASPILNNTVPAHTHGGTTNTENAYHTHVDSGHTHVVGTRQARPLTGSASLYNALDGGVAGVSYTESSSANLGTESALHAHDFTTGSQTNSGNWTPRYIDMIICSKN